MNSNWIFEDVNLFNLLYPHKFKEYKACHDFDSYNKGDYIYFEVDSANKVFLIEIGNVKNGYYNSDGTEVVKVILKKGEIFSKRAIFGQQRREEFAQFIDTNTSICPLDVDTIH